MSDILRKQNRMMNCPAVTAEQIPYRNVTVKDKLDELDNRASANTLGTVVNISAYTSNSKYTCPSDGYIYLSTSSAGSYVTASVNGILISAQQGGSNYNAIFVKKGMSVWVASSKGTFGAYFYPLEGSVLPSAESEGF